jgi:hypothetical protein
MKMAGKIRLSMSEQERFNLEQEILAKLKRICEPPSNYPFDPEKVMEVEKEVMERKIHDGEYPYDIAKEMCYSYLYKVRYHIIKG